MSAYAITKHGFFADRISVITHLDTNVVSKIRLRHKLTTSKNGSFVYFNAGNLVDNPAIKDVLEHLFLYMYTDVTNRGSHIGKSAIITAESHGAAYFQLLQAMMAAVEKKKKCRGYVGTCDGPYYVKIRYYPQVVEDSPAYFAVTMDRLEHITDLDSMEPLFFSGGTNGAYTAYATFTMWPHMLAAYRHTKNTTQYFSEQLAKLLDKSSDSQ